jgi:hypothetical protein
VTLKVALPIVLFAGVIGSWQSNNLWLQRSGQAISDAFVFFEGRVSLATAYGTSGGITPVALAAFRQAPAGDRIWSTNVIEYCMVPGCVIESVVSFKMSSEFNDILYGTPLTARAILQREHLNYFIVSANASMIDILPYSKLFAPSVIGRYLGVAWTNGNDYVLTWLGQPGVIPLGPDFMRAYEAQLQAVENPWFRFRELVPNMKQTMDALEASGHPYRHLEFAWRRAQTSQL